MRFKFGKSSEQSVRAGIAPLTAARNRFIAKEATRPPTTPRVMLFDRLYELALETVCFSSHMDVVWSVPAAQKSPLIRGREVPVCASKFSMRSRN
jgi:hypothetical protein